jgi:hypothetical protein
MSINFGHEIVWHIGTIPEGSITFMAYNPITERDIVTLYIADTSNTNISNISFN